MSAPMPAPSVGDETRIMPPIAGPPPPLDPAIAQQAAHAIDHGTPKEALPPDIAAAVDRLLDEAYREHKHTAVQAARNGDGRPADDLSDLDPAIVAQAAYAIDYQTPRNSLPSDMQAAYDRLQAIGYPRNRPGSPSSSPAGDRSAWPRALADGLAVGALIASLFGFSVVGIILGAIHASNAHKTKHRASGVAAWGIGLGIAGLVAEVLLIIVIIAAMASVSSAGYSAG